MTYYLLKYWKFISISKRFVFHIAEALTVSIENTRVLFTARPSVGQLYLVVLLRCTAVYCTHWITLTTTWTPTPTPPARPRSGKGLLSHFRVKKWAREAVLYLYHYYYCEYREKTDCEGWWTTSYQTLPRKKDHIQIADFKKKGKIGSHVMFNKMFYQILWLGVCKSVPPPWVLWQITCL